MISVEAALDHIFSLSRCLPQESIPLRQARGRMLRKEVIAARDQPPFDASAMDGYAIMDPAPQAGDIFSVIGTSSAGHGFQEPLAPSQAVRIFTGAPCPPGCQKILIQEDVRREGDQITLQAGFDSANYIRPRGHDFGKGMRFAAPRYLSARDLMLLAAMNIAEISVTRMPKIAILANGDELCGLGQRPAWDQITASNSYGVAARLEALGADLRVLPIARDNFESLEFAFSLASDADLIVTIGGASVGDHDLIQECYSRLGARQEFYKIAMRPGKPLMAGKWEDRILIGLPGNPVSAMVCTEIFLVPLLWAMLGLPAKPRQMQKAPLRHAVGANGPRAHYMRARIDDGEICVLENQDSSMMRLLTEANALVLRPPFDGARAPREILSYLTLID